MSRILSWLFVGACLLTLSSVKAAPKTPIIFDGVDITAFVDYYRHDVKKLTKEVSIYNWSQGASAFSSKNYGPEAPQFLALAQLETKAFWDHYGTVNNGGTYGTGLYAALDPVSTSSFGGLSTSQFSCPAGYVYTKYGCQPQGSCPIGTGSYNGTCVDQWGHDWILFEMKLPIGFNLVDLVHSAMQQRPILPEVFQIALKFDCPMDLNTFFTQGGTGVSPHCQSLVKKVFQDVFKIDGFAYDYIATYFEDCSAVIAEGSRAFVITDSKWIRPDNVRFWTEKTTYEPLSRARIQTLFFEAIKTSIAGPQEMVTQQITDLLTQLPSSYVAGTTTKCSADSCTITLHLCNDKNLCVDKSLQPIPRPGGAIITSREAAQTSAGRLLWSDLEGKPKTDTISIWLKDNYYACDGKLPYDDQSTKAAGESK